MPLTNAGRDLMVAAVIGEAITAFNNANSYLGAGDSAAAFAVGLAYFSHGVSLLSKDISGAIA